MVGVYAGVMYVNGEFPFLLPKFGIAINYMERRDAALTDDITIRIFLPGQEENGEPAFQGIVPAKQMRETVKPHPDADPALPRYLSIASNLIFSPLIIPQKGTIKVRAICGPETLRVGSLLVTDVLGEIPETS